MKTLQQVKKELKQALSVDGRCLGDSEYKRHEEHILFLKDIAAYLESKPNEKFIQVEKKRLQKVLDNISNGYALWLKNTPASEYGFDSSKAMPHYNRMSKKNKHKRHLANIEYILGK